MIGEFIKVATEEPEKITKGALRVINTILLVIIAEWLYRQFFGYYRLMNLGEFGDWTQFVLSGRIVIVIACYMLAKHIVEPVIQMVVYLFVVRFTGSRKPVKFDNSEISFFLRLFDVIKTDKNSKIPKPGKNIDVLYNLAKVFKEEESVEEVNSLKDSLVNNVLNLYAVFLVVYFKFIPSTLHNGWFTVIILLCFFVLISVYRLAGDAIRYMTDHHDELLRGMDYMKSYDAVYGFLDKYGIKPYRSGDRVNKEEFFEHGEKKFALLIGKSDKLPDPKDFAIYIERLQEKERYLFFVTKKVGQPETIAALAAMENKFTLICYEGDRDLRQQVNEKVLKKLL